MRDKLAFSAICLRWRSVNVLSVHSQGGGHCGSGPGTNDSYSVCLRTPSIVTAHRVQICCCLFTRLHISVYTLVIYVQYIQGQQKPQQELACNFINNILYIYDRVAYHCVSIFFHFRWENSK